MLHKIKQIIKNNSILLGITRKIYEFLFPIYPFSIGNEKKSLTDVLNSGKWNMSQGTSLAHNNLEKEFAEYIGVKHAIAVNTGGMAIQMSLRALGLKHGNEVIHQIDTCVANPFAVINANVTPIFSDISDKSFHLDFDYLENLIDSNTKAIMPIHLWGYPENMDKVLDIAKKYNLLVIEDCALALGAEWKNQKVGSFGDVGIFSFGSGKPIQSGEGGIITTNDDDLAKQLRTIRSWGEMTFEYGIRDHKILSWNGRMSEFVAAVALEQLRNYPNLLLNIRYNVQKVKEALNKIDGLSVINQPDSTPSYMQLVIRIESSFKLSKNELFVFFQNYSIAVWHANFEPVSTLSFFKERTWNEWIVKGDLDKVTKNYNDEYSVSNNVYETIGLGFMRNNFINNSNTLRLLYVLKKLNKEVK